MRLLVFALLATGLASADSLYLDDSFPDSVRPSLEALADNVWDVVAEMFHSSLPLNLPIHVYESNAEVPVTRVLDHEISIRITSHGTHYSQFAFQLGHELGHVMLDPRRSNGIVEAICIAVSYEVLSRIGPKLQMSPAYSWLGAYAPDFQPYRHDDEMIALEKLPPEVRAMVAGNRWSDVAAYLRDHRSEMEAGHPLERNLQTLAAMALRSAPLDWGQLAGIAACTTPSPAQDPQFKNLPLDDSCIARLPEIFCRIGRGCEP